MDALQEILKNALTLKPADKARLIDTLLQSLDAPDKELNQLWAESAEARLDAYEQGQLKAISARTGARKIQIGHGWILFENSSLHWLERLAPDTSREREKICEVKE